MKAVLKVAAFEPSQSVEVGSYRCYLLDKTGRFVDTKIFSARNDNEAAAYAFALFIRSSNVYERFEVWSKGSVVHAYSREAPESNENYQPGTQSSAPPDTVGNGWRVDELKGQPVQEFLVRSSPPNVQKGGWAAVRSLAIAFVVTLAWILMFENTVLKLLPTHSSAAATSTQISELP